MGSLVFGRWLPGLGELERKNLTFLLPGVFRGMLFAQAPRRKRQRAGGYPQEAKIRRRLALRFRAGK